MNTDHQRSIPRQQQLRRVPGAGSITARRLIPIAFISPAVLGSLVLLGERRGLYTVGFGVSILVLSIIICFVWVIWYNAQLLNRRDQIQRKTQQDLDASEQIFSLLIAGIRDYAIFMVDPAGRIRSWNPGAEAIHGYSAPEVIGQSLGIFYPPDELEQNEPAYNLHLAEIHGTYRSEAWRMRKNGTRFWADIVFTPLYDEQGQLKGFAQVIRDMSEQKKATEMIRYQARLMEDISDAVISTDREFRVLSWNRATESLYGYTLAEAYGRDIGELLRSSADPAIRYAVRELLAEGGYWHGENIYYTKKDIPLNILVSVSATRNEQSIMTGYVIVCRDITERLKAEQRLRKFNEELTKRVQEKTKEVREFFERVTDAFIAYDTSGNIVYMNGRAKEMTGKAGGKPGKNIWRDFPVALANAFGQHFRSAMQTQTGQHFEMRSEMMNIWVECHMYPSANGVSHFFRDITAQKEAQEQLSRSNSELRALASHLQDIREEERAGIAREIHDGLGQQLTVLKMNLAWFGEKLGREDSPELHRRAADSLVLVDQTIMAVRKIAADLRPGILDDLGLVAAVEWLAGEFQKRSGIQTVFRAGMPTRHYPKRMSVAIFRICQEALTNVARHAAAGKVDIFLGYEEEDILLRVADDGRGISEAVRKGGRGTLGLLGMKERALMMGGKLEIDSVPEKGVALTVRVPLGESDNH